MMAIRAPPAASASVTVVTIPVCVVAESIYASAYGVGGGEGEKEETILRNINPVSRSFFTGQDIKSDGFSIETCKIMVDMLDVSFQAVSRCCFSA